MSLRLAFDLDGVFADLAAHVGNEVGLDREQECPLETATELESTARSEPAEPSEVGAPSEPPVRGPRFIEMVTCRLSSDQ